MGFENGFGRRREGVVDGLDVVIELGFVVVLGFYPRMVGVSHLGGVSREESGFGLLDFGSFGNRAVGVQRGGLKGGGSPVSMERLTVKMKMNGFGVFYFGGFGDGTVVVERSGRSVIFTAVRIIGVIVVRGGIVMGREMRERMESGFRLVVGLKQDGLGVLDFGSFGHGSVVVQRGGLEIFVVTAVRVIVVVGIVSAGSGQSGEMFGFGVFHFGRLVDGTVVLQRCSEAVAPFVPIKGFVVLGEVSGSGGFHLG